MWKAFVGAKIGQGTFYGVRSEFPMRCKMIRTIGVAILILWENAMLFIRLDLVDDGQSSNKIPNIEVLG